LGVGLWSATLAVRYRDLRNAIGYGLRVWMYVTPVAYAASLIPEILLVDEVRKASL